MRYRPMSETRFWKKKLGYVKKRWRRRILNFFKWSKIERLNVFTWKKVFVGKFLMFFVFLTILFVKWPHFWVKNHQKIQIALQKKVEILQLYRRRLFFLELCLESQKNTYLEYFRPMVPPVVVFPWNYPVGKN